MEAFSLLNFWRNAAAGDDAGGGYPDADFTNGATANNNNGETDEDDDSFFDFDFTVAKNGEIDGSVEDDDDLIKDLIGKNGGGRSDFVKSPCWKPRSPISFLRSQPKSTRVLLFEKSKLEKKTETETTNSASLPATSKRFSAKRGGEEVSIGSLFARDNSLRSQILKQSSDDDSSKRFPNHVMRKYLRLIKPLYVRVSKSYGEKLKPSNRLSTTTAPPMCSPRKQVDEKQPGSRAAALRVVCKLGKSRSASSAVGIVPTPAASRRDDSLLQQHDGIQSAILHCKRSLSSSRESSILAR